MAYGLTQSADLNGSSQYFTAADSASLSPTGNQTHEGWFYFDTTPSSGNGFQLLGKYDDGGGGQRAISFVYENSGGTLRFNMRVSSNGAAGTSGTLNYTFTTAAWHFVRFVYTAAAGNIDVYVDDTTTPVGSVNGYPTSVFNSTAVYGIGFNNVVAGQYFDGNVSLVRVWDAVHTTADQCTVYGTSTTNMQAEWSLNNVLTDASGNGNTLTNNGTATFEANVPALCVPTGPTSVKTVNGVTAI